jgi:hypothetical protein
MTGLEFLAQSKQIQPDATRILITGVVNLNTVIEAINQGEIYRFIVKPWIREELLASVRNAVQRHELICRNRDLQRTTLAMNEQLAALNRSLEDKVEAEARHSHQLAELNRALAENLDRSVQICLKTLQTFYPSLGGQARQVHAICHAMAEIIPLDPEERRVLEMGAWLHDIGLHEASPTESNLTGPTAASPSPLRFPPMSSPAPIPGFRPVPFTGVIYVMAEAGKLGYRYGHPDWCNLGQGQPETGPLPGAPPRVHRVEIGVDDQDYAPIPGIWELRRAVAELYNRLYRRGKRSQYTERNVCVCGGGRSSLTRAVAALGQVNLGHFLPDYTAYEELLDIFKLFTSIPILLDGREAYHFSPEHLREEITGRGLSAVLLSNPCNPTGRVIVDQELEGWVTVARELSCSLLIDEF